MNSDGEPSAKRAREEDGLDPNWILNTLRTTFNQINNVVRDLDLRTVNTPLDESVRHYTFALFSLGEVLDKLPATLKKRSKEDKRTSAVATAEYIMACYKSRSDEFDPSVAMLGISNARNSNQDHWRNMVRADAQGVANLIVPDGEGDADDEEWSAHEEGDADDEEGSAHEEGDADDEEGSAHAGEDD
jgi:hypothetical protein